MDDWTVDEDVDDSTGIEDDGLTFDEDCVDELSCATPRQAIASKAATRTTDVRILVQTKKKNQSISQKKTHKENELPRVF